ncbi:MAG: hypothetical protein LBS09_05680 [Bacteroidales bacterium]|jgi:hypothetical protein|nr:hypothetical protein [Bacteroidales bacterium]
MDIFIDLLKIVLPSIILLAAVCYIVGGFLRNSEKHRQLKAAKDNRKIITPLRLQAYERLVLFLERTSPDSIVLHANYPDNTAEQLHQELLQTIRAEYEHNLTQQLYVSPEAWESVRNAKNYTVSLINAAAQEMEDNASAIELSRKILSMTAEMEQPPTQKAVNQLKAEIRQLFN